METTPKGANFLKVCGILMIIGGAAAIIASILGFAGIAVLASLGANSALLTVSVILALVGGVIELIAGIIGVKNCKDPSKATTCIVWGVLVAVLTVVSLIINSVAGGNFSVVSLITGLIIPILFIIGAVLNKKSA